MTSDVTVTSGKHAQKYLTKSSELVKASMAWQSLQHTWRLACFAQKLEAGFSPFCSDFLM